ncbi:glucans biosynthesis glucosyltransferase MdoH [Pseudoalteromonas sp. SR44-5]|jgi:membrane glycosyltransferase|uniref:Glucans biosynthesis glucosyltransferase H n=3 Tax=Pseudoalteromonas TaxID=53246 RepID=A0ABY3FGL6_9GAMM|nr:MULTISPECIES: glucans biosynthesis glucosyltransferase MdoH [Pseudoalteromonas]MBB1293256.1 glucans biosynthesis glucosyltransferase MdoH [Pseudoalteromonas sp. SR41-4]MBB1331692.1 glucans biosynthesis glucosyltransferase MdoH [Pseudoalteromonas sp. SR41-6]MBB1365082.1 glucans biosynthesis glucosyltransferase MdoH [Pseudoalteromonas sp. SR44-5]MBB1433332.1 glucans biosynthesis glucosyltransferase MdoH [Pseudoalteromonas sp. SG43-6]MBB1458710.1 glucans biosynthesis glucosyltransferase MdoH [
MSGIQMTSSNSTMPFKKTRVWLFSLLVLAISAYGMWIMFDILNSNGMTPLEYALLALFSITFTWIVTAFCSGCMGFILQLFRIDPLTLTRQKAIEIDQQALSKTRTAVVMPIYNEDTQRVIAGFEVSLRSLIKTGQFAHFDFYLLSDTQDKEIANNELKAWHALTERLGDFAKQTFYRRREDNKHRKVGNLTDFCERWGSKYEHMIVLDADSIMTGQCMLELTSSMINNPQAGLIQTIPIPVRQDTFFGRFLQFASVLYSPMLATGSAFWQTNHANYWGHNAVIRVKAFIDCCGLPVLKGNAPFGGEILSHDFVEASLLHRSGWDVLLLSDIQGSYEEVPSNILDYAIRDRRWVQGNIQHLGLLPASGLKIISKLHFLLGATAYISSLIWLSMLVLSTIDAVTRALNSNVYFNQAYQLFPTWQIAKTELINSLLFVTIVLLLLPKLMGIIVTLIHRNKQFGGSFKLILGSIIETVFAIIIAPLMMVFHSYFVVCVFLGKKVTWDAQPRSGRMVPWQEAIGYTLLSTLIALAWGGIAYYFTPVFFWWLSPILVGLILAAPIVRYSSSIGLGVKLRKMGIFICPSEVDNNDTLAALRVHEQEIALPNDDVANFTIPTLGQEQPSVMPIQSFKRQGLSKRKRVLNAHQQLKKKLFN